MIPKSLSATAIQVAEACPARFHAEHIERSKGEGNVAANLGTAVHGALESYVKMVYLGKKTEPSKKLLLDMFKLSYMEVFNTTSTDSVEYMEGYQMLETWFARTDVGDIRRVVSCEIKTFFEIPTSIGPIPFNYIWDRFDEIKPGVFRVVDYKSNRWNITSADLQKKVQARCYGLAAAIQLKQQGVEYERIWVQFDMLRHSPVGRVFTREDNLATWNFLVETAERLIAMPDVDDQGNRIALPERLNDSCNFCVRKAACNALKKNILVGGVHSLPSIEAAIDLRAEVEWQQKGLNALIAELDKKILGEARERDQESFESDRNELEITVGRQRKVDAEMVEMAIGPKLFEKYGSRGITMGTIDKLLKGKELTNKQKADVRSLIYMQTGEPRVKVRPKNPIDE